MNTPTKSPHHLPGLLAGIALTLTATLVFSHHTANWPPNLDPDTGVNGILVLNWLHQGQWPWFLQNTGAVEPVIIYLQSLSTALLGPSVFSLRIVTVFAGILTTPMVWQLVRTAAGDDLPGAAGMAALFVATSFSLAWLSHWGLRASLLPFTIALSLWAWLVAWQGNRYRWWALAGLISALSLYIYLSARFLPVALALWLGWQLLVNRPAVLARWRGFALAVGVSMIVLTPAILFYSHSPHFLLQRAGQVTFNNSPVYLENGPLAYWQLKLSGVWEALFHHWPGKYNLTGMPFFTRPAGIAWLAGCGVALWRIRRPAESLLLVSMVAMALPDLLSNNTTLHELRIFGAVPAMLALAGLGTGWILSQLQGLRHGRWLQIALVVGVAFAQGAFLTRARAEAARFGCCLDEAMRMAELVNDHADVPMLVGVADYDRPEVIYLSASNFPRRAIWPLDTPLPVDEVLVVTGISSQEYYSFETLDHRYDPYAWVFLYQGQAWLLPPFEHPLIPATHDIIYPPPASALGPEAFGSWMSTADLGDFVEMQTPHPLPFGEQGQLLGYNLSGATLSEQYHATLFWQIMPGNNGPQRILAQVLDDDLAVLGTANIEPGYGVFQPALFDEGTVIATHHLFDLPPDLPSGGYHLEIGLIDILTDRRIIISDGNQSDHALLGPLRVPLGSPTPLPTPETVLDVDFGGNLRLVGADLPATAAPGDLLTIQLYWQGQRPSDEFRTRFVHLGDAQTVLAQADGQPRPDYPLILWGAGDYIVDQVTLTLPPDLPPGEHGIWIGLYGTLTGERVAASASGLEIIDNRVQIGAIMAQEQ